MTQVDFYDKGQIDAKEIGAPDDAASESGSLWARIKNAVARIVTLETADTNNVKKTGTSTVTGTLEVPTTPPTPTSVVNSVYVNDATAGVNNLIHKTGNETIDGVKSMNDRIDSVWTTFDITQPASGWQSKDIIVIKDKNQLAVANMVAEYNGANDISALRFMLLLPNNDSCGFSLRFENGTVKLELRKTVNGSYSSTNIGTL